MTRLVSTVRLLPAPGGPLEYLVTGSGAPVTLFVPGLGGGIPDTRPLGSGVPGTKVFVRIPLADRDPAASRYAHLAADLAVAADEFAATRALGVSLGAGALCRLVADHPQRFERLVCFLPAVVDVPRGEAAKARLRAVADAVAASDGKRLAEVFAGELPEPIRHTPQARRFVADRVANLTRGAGRSADAAALAGVVAGLADDVPVADVAALRRVTAPMLVIGCRGDELHPVGVAQRLAAVLPKATLHVYDEPAPLWTHRVDLRRRISSWLSA